MVQLSFTVDPEPKYLVTGLLIWCPQALSQVQTAVQKTCRNGGQLRKDVLGVRCCVRQGRVPPEAL